MSLASIDIPDSVCEIEENAFRCTGMTSFRFPAALRTIGPYAFANTKLAQAELPEQLASLGKRAFFECPLREIRIPAGVETLTAGLFEDCRQLESVDNNGSIRTIEAGAFSGCRELKSVQVAYGAVFDANHIFVDPLWPSKHMPPAKEVRITQLTVLRGREWDVIRRESVSMCKAAFVPVPYSPEDDPGTEKGRN